MLGWKLSTGRHLTRLQASVAVYAICKQYRPDFVSSVSPEDMVSLSMLLGPARVWLKSMSKASLYWSGRKCPIYLPWWPFLVEKVNVKHIHVTNYSRDHVLRSCQCYWMKRWQTLPPNGHSRHMSKPGQLKVIVCKWTHLSHFPLHFRGRNLAWCQEIKADVVLSAQESPPTHRTA